MTHVDRENASSFVYRHPTTHRAVFVPDRHYQANLFRVNGGAEGGGGLVRLRGKEMGDVSVSLGAGLAT